MRSVGLIATARVGDGDRALPVQLHVVVGEGLHLTRVTSDEPGDQGPSLGRHQHRRQRSRGGCCRRGDLGIRLGLAHAGRRDVHHRDVVHHRDHRLVVGRLGPSQEVPRKMKAACLDRF